MGGEPELPVKHYSEQFNLVCFRDVEAVKSNTWLAAPRVVGGGQFEVLGTLLAQTLSSRLNPNDKWHRWPAARLHWRLVYPWL